MTDTPDAIARRRRTSHQYDRYRTRLRIRLSQSQVPTTLHDGLTEYIVARRPTGDFLYAVLSNDLSDAVRRADPENLQKMHSILSFLWSHAPTPCWGSREKVTAWLSGFDADDTELEELSL